MKLSEMNKLYEYSGTGTVYWDVYSDAGFVPTLDIVKTPCSLLYRYGFKAMQRFRVAHSDFVAAISKKDEDLQNVLRNTDPTTLQSIEEQAACSSTGIGVYRQKGAVDRESDLRGRSSTLARPVESPEKIRDKFAQSLEVRDGPISVAAVPKANEQKQTLTVMSEKI